MRKYVCDRCGSVSESYDDIFVVTEPWSVDKKDKIERELCRTCRNGLKKIIDKWMKT